MSSQSKSESRIRRAGKTRIRISQQDKPRLSVFKSSQNLYAQIFAATRCFGRKACSGKSSCKSR